MTSSAARLGRIGIWSGGLRFGDAAQRGDIASEIEALGFGAIWFPGGVADGAIEVVDELLAATHKVGIATGIINAWKEPAAKIGAWWPGVSTSDRARVMLGLGISHGPLIGEEYRSPMANMTAYIDRLDAAGVPSRDVTCLAALGPKMLDLAATRTAGAHPYLVTPEHTAMARQRMGAGALLAPQQGVIMETDPGKAREVARQSLSGYMRLPNYVNSWRRQGFDEDDVTTPSDRLLDALFAWGGMDRIAERVKAHLDAGADHVCLQVYDGGQSSLGAYHREAWRQLAQGLL